MPRKSKPPVKAKAKGVTVSNQAKLDPHNQIPFEYGSEAFSFVNQTAYLPFLYPKDSFGKMLLEARLNSVTHNSCIVTKKDYCAGEGFEDSNSKVLPVDFKGWLGSMNRKNESITEINKKIFEDFFTWGNVPIEIVRFTVAGSKKICIYVGNFLEWRLCKPDDDDIVNAAIKSKLFTRNALITADQVKKSKQIPIYNPLNRDKENWIKGDQGEERTLIWYKNSVSGFPYYGLPSAAPTLIYQILEYKGARYNLDNFDNNMIVAALLLLKGQLGQEEADRIGRMLINTHTGDGRRGRTLVVASDEGVQGSEYHKMETKTDGSYTEADDKWTQKIILANQWDSVLAGLVSPSTLGKGSGFLTKILELKLNTVIRPAQRDLMDKVWKHILKLANDWMGFKLDGFDIVVSNSIDISGLTDVDITQAVQVNEVREAKGLQADPGMKGKYMKAKGQNPDTGGDNV